MSGCSADKRRIACFGSYSRRRDASRPDVRFPPVRPRRLSRHRSRPGRPVRRNGTRTGRRNRPVSSSSPEMPLIAVSRLPLRVCPLSDSRDVRCHRYGPVSVPLTDEQGHHPGRRRLLRVAVTSRSRRSSRSANPRPFGSSSSRLRETQFRISPSPVPSGFGTRISATGYPANHMLRIAVHHPLSGFVIVPDNDYGPSGTADNLMSVIPGRE